MVDLDELDRMHASLPELEANSWLSYEDNETAVVIATVLSEDDSGVDDAKDLATNAVAILNAYPALAAEVRRLESERYAMEQRAIEAEALYQPQRESEENLRAQLEKVRSILTELDRAIYDYRACREGVQTQGGHNLVDRKFTAQRLTEALAKVPR